VLQSNRATARESEVMYCRLGENRAPPSEGPREGYNATNASICVRETDTAGDGEGEAGSDGLPLPHGRSGKTGIPDVGGRGGGNGYRMTLASMGGVVTRARDLARARDVGRRLIGDRIA
jgi:hypothetical protein